jgi:hypothetical protein
MRSVALAEALAGRFTKVVPAGISVQADGPGVSISTKGKPASQTIMTASILDDSDDPRSEVKKVEELRTAWSPAFRTS